MWSTGIRPFAPAGLISGRFGRTSTRVRCGPAPLVWRGEIRLSGCRAHSDRPHAGASLGRGSVAQGRVQALPIVKHLDVLEHRRPRLRAGAEPGLMDALRLERGEEALHGRIIETIAAPAHRWL